MAAKTARSEEARPLPAPAPAPDAQLSYVTKRALPPREPKKSVAGVYRMIHGNVEVPVPLEQRQNADGSENLHLAKTVRAGVHILRDASGKVTGYVGDELWLNDADAERMLAADLIEPLDAKPSRVGKVFTPPKETKTWAAHTAARA